MEEVWGASLEGLLLSGSLLSGRFKATHLRLNLWPWTLAGAAPKNLLEPRPPEERKFSGKENLETKGAPACARTGTHAGAAPEISSVFRAHRWVTWNPLISGVGAMLGSNHGFEGHCDGLPEYFYC